MIAVIIYSVIFGPILFQTDVDIQSSNQIVNEIHPIINTFLYYVLPFLFPGALITFYQWDIDQLKPDDSLIITDKIKRKAINTPFITAFLSMTGWLVSFLTHLIVTSYQYGKIFVINAENVYFYLTFLFYNTTLAVIVFMISFHLMDFMNRKYFISYFFPDNQISHIRGTVYLSIKTKFFIYFFTAGFFPVISITHIAFLISRHPYLFPKLIPLSVFYIITSAVITFLTSKNYENPVQLLNHGVEKIKENDYSYQINVTSGDELGQMTEAFNQMTKGLKEKEMMNETFGKIVDPAVRDYLLDGNLELGGSLQKCAVLFSDIRNFTSLSENLTPQNVVYILNQYFEEMSRIINQSHGLVNKYIGDAVMALFGVPVPLENNADESVRSAVLMHRSLNLLNKRLQNDSYPQIGMGIGIHYGEVLAGNIGAKNRMEYTVIGDHVNLASRIEGLTKYYRSQILISEDLKNQLNHAQNYHIHFIDSVKVKGRQKPVRIYEITDGLSGKEFEYRNSFLNSISDAVTAFHEGDLSGAEKMFAELQQQSVTFNSEILLENYLKRCRQLKNTNNSHHLSAEFEVK